jgi:hypothetical protein
MQRNGLSRDLHAYFASPSADAEAVRQLPLLMGMPLEVPLPEVIVHTASTPYCSVSYEILFVFYKNG